jgi:hypothetical protein
MGRLASEQATLNRDLTEAAVELMEDAQRLGFIGSSIMPVKNVSEKSGSYPKIPIEAILKQQDLQRAARSKYPRDDYEFESGSYTCKEFGFESVMPDVERSLYSSFFDGDFVATMRAVDKVLRAQELRIADLLFDTGVITTTQAATANWSVIATATPRSDIMELKQAMRVNRGIVPNVVAMDISIFDEFLLTEEVKDAFKYTNPIEMGGLEAQRRIAAQYFQVDEVLVGGAIQDTAKKGKESSLSGIWGITKVGLYKRATSEDMQDPVIGRTFAWEKEGGDNIVTEEYREEAVRSDIYRARHFVDEAIVFAGAGAILTGV